MYCRTLQDVKDYVDNLIKEHGNQSLYEIVDGEISDGQSFWIEKIVGLRVPNKTGVFNDYFISEYELHRNSNVIYNTLEVCGAKYHDMIPIDGMVIGDI